MSVALIGNFMYETPDDIAIGSLNLLLAYFKIRQYVTANFILYAMCEVRPTDSPGVLLYNRLDELCKSTNSYPHICQHLVNYSYLLTFVYVLNLLHLLLLEYLSIVRHSIQW